MYPNDGQGQRRSHRAQQQPPPPKPPQDASNYFYDPNHTQNQSPQAPPTPNGMHHDAFQTPQPEPPQQPGYANYAYNNYAPAMQYPQTSPHVTSNAGPYNNRNSHPRQQQQQHPQQQQQGMQRRSMQGQGMQNQPMQNQPMQNQFYASAWEPNSPVPVYPQPPPQQQQPANGMGAMQQQQRQRGMSQPLPPTTFYNPAAGAHAPHSASAQHFAPGYTHQQPQAPPQHQQHAGAFGGPGPGLQNAVPLMMAGMRLAGGAGGGGGGVGGTPGEAAALGAQLFQTFAPVAGGYLGSGRESVSSFMRLPKYYFTVNHAYVLRKLLLLLKPWGARTWARQRAVDPGQFGEAAGGDAAAAAASYLPPREDVNAPDLYIPVMAFATYVLLVGFMHGLREEFKAELLARHFSKGAGVLCLEAVMIKLGLYLINARATPWLDVIAYRGYKFVGVALTMAVSLVVPRLYWATLAYSASMMGLFLMRSHRRIVMPREAVNNPADLARRNAFLLFLCALQYPIYWVLVKY